MKNKFILFVVIVLGLSFQANAQLDFESHIIREGKESLDHVKEVITMDIDGDGDLDVLTASAEDNKIAWYENLDERADFGPQQIITESLHQAHSIFAVDIDGDGDLDVVAASYYLVACESDKIAWYENLDGKGTFGDGHILSINFVHVADIYPSDIDGDGDIDIVFSSISKRTIAWYENLDGKGEFSLTYNFIDQNDGGTELELVDIDNDGDMDVLTNSFNDRNNVVWYENLDGTDEFGVQQIISIDMKEMPLLYPSDIDGDGDMDVIAASKIQKKIVWFENVNGLGMFQQKQTIFLDSIDIVDLSSGDLDIDGDMDIVIISSNKNGIVSYENINGQGDFVENVRLDTREKYGSSIFISDMNGDGKNDILAAVRNNIYWYNNESISNSFSQAIDIINGIRYIEDIIAVDIDGDNDLDLISAINGIGLSINNNGKGDFEIMKVLPGSRVGVISIVVDDVDGDGDLDILSSGYRLIAWHEHLDGNGNFGEESEISKSFVSDQNFVGQSLFFEDLDGDGDKDIITGSILYHSLNWYEHLDGKGNFSEMKNIDKLKRIISIYVEDLDSDGDLDILANSRYEIFWYENIDGLANFESKKTIESYDRTSAVYGGDIDGDGDVDIIASITSPKKIIWFENLGEGVFGEEQIVAADYIGNCDLHITDLDHDGDVDIIASYQDSIVWFENINGLGLFSDQLNISTGLLRPKFLNSADLDGDGDEDIISSSRLDLKLVWHENLNILSNKEIMSMPFTLTPNPTSRLIYLESEKLIKWVEIYNVFGQLVMSLKEPKEVDISILLNGLYYCKVTAIDGSIGVKEIIKQN